jgi:16S rRNA (cytosine967-C5)-methyltransferase
VDDAVDLVRAARKPSATGFVNAVLRSLLRQRHKLPLPARPETGSRQQQVDYLGITHSHPGWLVDRWLARHGFEAAEAWTRFNNDTPALTVRVNTLRSTVEGARRTLEADGVETEPARHAPSGLIVTAGNPLRRPADGLVFVQDEASQLVPLLVDAQPGERVLDLCASPGGKTTAMAAMAGDRAEIVATDVRPARVQLLRETVGASGAQNIRVLQADLEAGLPFRPEFDIVFVDAPCSGLGTVRRDPDIRWRRAEADLAALASAQLNMIRHAADAVRPGGRLIYSTCSSEPEENDQVVAMFLAANSHFEKVDLRAEKPAYFDALEPVLDDSGALRTSPAQHGLEAFYGAVLRRVK